MEKLDKKFSKTVAPQQAYIKRYGLNLFAKVIELSNQLEEAGNQYAAKLLQYYTAYYDAYENALKKLLASCQQASKVGDVRSKEIEFHHDFNKLLDVWQRNDMEHRCLSWVQMHPSKVANWDEATRKRYDDCLVHLTQKDATHNEVAKITMASYAETSVKISS